MNIQHFGNKCRTSSDLTVAVLGGSALFASKASGSSILRDESFAQKRKRQQHTVVELLHQQLLEFLSYSKPQNPGLAMAFRPMELM
jgi:hypothetical protein